MDETILNPDYINRANSASHFDAGSGIDQEAKKTLGLFDAEFTAEGLTDEQKEYLEQRRNEWREFVIDHYNDQCRRRAEYMPVTVCGPARYPAERMEKRVRKIMALASEFKEKAGRFFNNTHKRLEELTPLDVQLDQLRAGQWYRGDTIPASDPHVIEKLSAMLAHLEKAQEGMKAANQAIRKGKTQEDKLAGLVAIGFTEAEAHDLLKPDFCGRVGFPGFRLTNNNANIKRIRDRIVHIQREKESPTIQGWTFEGGEVVANQDADRLQILFDSRPDAAMISKLKGKAFRWSPRNKAWQRQLTRNAVSAAKVVLESEKGGAKLVSNC